MQHKFVQIREVTWKPTLIILGVAATLCCTQARAAIVYQNDFETPATAFSGLAASGTLAVLSTASLPTDSGGLASANHSTWLGRLGLGVAKSNTTSEIVMLSLTGLVPSTQYSVSFDLFIGGSWDGSAFSFGPDEWSLTAASGGINTNLVDATFSNCGVSNQLCGASSPQSYSDNTPLGGLGPNTFIPTTGADFSFDTNLDYSQDYAIYSFGHGSGNPLLTFSAGASTGTLVFQRKPIASGDSSDEYWAIDNLTVSGSAAAAVPEPASVALFTTGLLLVGLRHWRKCA